jgi:hypothetical protein
MRIEFDEVNGLAMIRLSRFHVADTTIPVDLGELRLPEDSAAAVNLDFEEGRLVGIEVIDAERLLPPDMLRG